MSSCMSPTVLLKSSMPAVLLPSIAVLRSLLCDGDCVPAADAGDMSIHMPAYSSRQG